MMKNTWDHAVRSLLLVVTILPTAWVAGQSTPSSSEARPNILLCIADDMSWSHTSVNGDPVSRTPNFDRLATVGARFEHAYASTPSCTPSRAALLTGQAFCRLEVGASLLSTLPAKFAVYPDLLEQAGYVVGATGKGWGPGDFRPGGRTRNPAGPGFRSFRAFLEQRPADKPFCFWLGSVDPHRPYKAGSGNASGIDPKMVAVPPIVPDSAEIRADLADYLFEVQRFDRDVGAALADLKSRGLLDNTLVVMTSDNGMPYPRGKCNLYDWGTRMPLVIAWPGRIPPGRVISDFVSLTDLAPTFLDAAGVPVPTDMTGRSLLDALKSDRNGRVEEGRDHAFFGRERHDVFRVEEGHPVGYPSRGIRTERFLYIRNFKPDRIPSGDSPADNQDNDRGPAKTYVVTHKDDPKVRPFYERAYGKRPAEELYDLSKDPDQVNNVAEQREYGDALAEMRREMDREMTSLQDPRRPGGADPDVFDRYPVHRTPKPGEQ
jgi:uncharacterized sulfatase